MPSNIYLTGMPGAGKTFWGRKIATFSGSPHVDLDEVIEKHQGQKIESFLSPENEFEFRELETKILTRIVQDAEEPFVLSCGGGTVLAPGNRKLLRQSGKIIYLKASLETLLKNLLSTPQQRPLLKGMADDPRKALSNLLLERRKIYEQADFILEVENLSVNDFAPILQLCLKQD